MAVCCPAWSSPRIPTPFVMKVLVSFAAVKHCEFFAEGATPFFSVDSRAPISFFFTRKTLAFSTLVCPNFERRCSRFRGRRRRAQSIFSPGTQTVFFLPALRIGLVLDPHPPGIPSLAEERHAGGLSRASTTSRSWGYPSVGRRGRFSRVIARISRLNGVMLPFFRYSVPGSLWSRRVYFPCFFITKCWPVWASCSPTSVLVSRRSRPLSRRS